MTQLLSRSDTQIVKTLIEDKLLPDWSGKVCPKCNKGILSSLKVHCGDKTPKYRCSHYKCHQRVHPQHLHPFFQACRGPEGHSLQVQAALLLALLLRVPLASIHIMLGINHKAVEDMQRRLEEIRRKFVEKKEKHIVFGKSKTWIDVEGDEVTFDKHDISQDPVLGHEVKGDKCVLWEQWCGLVQRGKPETLIMTRLKPGLTVRRAPGPGPISKHDWTPLGKKHLAGKNIIFHTDSARAYKLKLRDVLHDSVVHKKKRVKKSGKWVWTKPTFVKVVTHKLPGGKKIKVKAGTQHIDRCWKFIKERVCKGTHSRAGLKRLHFKIRAAQYEYWHRGSDMWKCTGDLVQDHMSGVVAQP